MKRKLMTALLVALVAMAGCSKAAGEKKQEQAAGEKKQEQAKEPKAEEPKAEEPKAEEPKAKEPKAEEPKAEEPKAKEPKAEEPKAEEPKAEEPKAEEPKAKERDGNPRVLFETTLGNFTVELYPEKTPVTVENFLRYVDDQFYNGLIFHRVVPGFVIQAGGFEPDLAKRPTREPIVNEAQQGIPNERGTLSMARTPARSSATSQFYVNLRNNSMLNYRGESPSGWGYCAYGKVIDGMDVIDKIAAVETGAAGPFPKDVPVVPVVITKASRVK